MLEFEINEIETGILWLNFDNSYEMNMSMLRIQEFAESPKFAGKFFTIEEYMDWYAYNEHLKNKKRPLELGFDYLTRVEGCNINNVDCEKFFEVYTDCLSDRELIIKDKIEDFAYERCGRPYYIITSYGNNKLTLSHEVAHARFYLNKFYRDVCLAILHHNKSNAFNQALINRGYCEKSLLDETHAYALTGWPKWYPWYKRDRNSWKISSLLRSALPIYTG